MCVCVCMCVCESVCVCCAVCAHGHVCECVCMYVHCVHMKASGRKTMHIPVTLDWSSVKEIPQTLGRILLLLPRK